MWSAHMIWYVGSLTWTAPCLVNKTCCSKVESQKHSHPDLSQLLSGGLLKCFTGYLWFLFTCQTPSMWVPSKISIISVFYIQYMSSDQIYLPQTAFNKLKTLRVKHWLKKLKAKAAGLSDNQKIRALHLNTMLWILKSLSDVYGLINNAIIKL